MNRILPGKRDNKWFLWVAVYGVALTILLGAVRFLVWDQDFDSVIAFRFVLLSFFLAIVVNGFGWLGARWIWTLTSAGLAAGLGAMFFYAYRDMAGWEDLAGLLAFLECVIIGFALGIVAEVIRYIRIKRTKHR